MLQIIKEAATPGAGIRCRIAKLLFTGLSSDGANFEALKSKLCIQKCVQFVVEGVLHRADRMMETLQL
jgi:hypothetical protein